MSIELENAINTLTAALREDPDYRQAWKANIAMAFYDEYFRSTDLDEDIAQVANKAAEYFLQNLCRQGCK